MLVYNVVAVVYNRVQGAEAEAAAAERQEIVKEYKVEKDDEETLIKAREWDDWKDGTSSSLLNHIILCHIHSISLTQIVVEIVSSAPFVLKWQLWLPVSYCRTNPLNKHIQ